MWTNIFSLLPVRFACPYGNHVFEPEVLKNANNAQSALCEAYFPYTGKKGEIFLCTGS